MSFVRGGYYLYRILFGYSSKKFGFLDKKATLRPPIEFGNTRNVYIYGETNIGPAYISAVNANFIIKKGCAVAGGLRVQTGNHARIIGTFVGDVREDGMLHVTVDSLDDGRGEEFAEADAVLIDGIVRFRASGPEDGDEAFMLCHGLERVDEFGHDAEDAPRLFGVQVDEIGETGEIGGDGIGHASTSQGFQIFGVLFLGHELVDLGRVDVVELVEPAFPLGAGADDAGVVVERVVDRGNGPAHGGIDVGGCGHGFDGADAVAADQVRTFAGEIDERDVAEVGRGVFGDADDGFFAVRLDPFVGLRVIFVHTLSSSVKRVQMNRIEKLSIKVCIVKRQFRKSPYFFHFFRPFA